MWKVIIIGGLVAIFAVFGYSDSPNTIDGCLYQDQQWPSVDGTKFYFCIPELNISVEQSCPPGRVFVKNATTTGCLPVEAVSDECAYHGEVQPCTGENLNQPQPSQYPTQFYLCPELNAEPVLLTCVNNGAFAKQDGYMGCFDWAEWRRITGCSMGSD